MVIYLYNANNTNKGFISRQRKILKITEETVNEIKKFSVPSYFIIGAQRENRGPVQFLNKNEPLNCITYKDFYENYSVKEDLIISSYLLPIRFLPDVEMEMMVSSDYLRVFHRVLVESKDEVAHLGILQLASNAFLYNDLNNHTEQGVAIYGPYITLESGQYQCSIQLKLEKYLDSNLGFIDILATLGGKSHQQIFKQEISYDDFNESNQIFALSFDLPQEAKDVQFRVFVTPGTNIVMEKVILKKTSDEPN
jgi:hypothetical protein